MKNINGNMKAYILHRPGLITMEEIAIPRPNPGEALIRTKMVGICGSDIHAFHGLQPSMVYPCIMGHEILGEVIELNNDRVQSKIKRTIKVGDRVAVDPSITCGKCYPCSIGRSNICENLKVLGVHRNGAYAEYFTVDINQLYQVPNEIPDEVAILSEPLSIAAQAIDRGRVEKKDKVIIFGAGPIGLTTLTLIKWKGAKVAVIDIIPSRLVAAENIGADRVINGQIAESDILSEIKSFCPGSGPQVVVDAVSVKQTAKLSIECISKTGRLVVLGMAYPEVHIPYLTILKKELDILGSRMANDKFPVILDFLQKSILAHKLKEQLITHTFPFEKISEAFSFVEKHPEKLIKVIISFKK